MTPIIASFMSLDVRVRVLRLLRSAGRDVVSTSINRKSVSISSFMQDNFTRWYPILDKTIKVFVAILKKYI